MLYVISAVTPKAEGYLLERRSRTKFLRFNPVPINSNFVLKLIKVLLVLFLDVEVSDEGNFIKDFSAFSFGRAVQSIKNA